MKTYRIIKVITTNGAGESKDHYTIQKLGINGFKNVKPEFVYHTHRDWNRIPSLMCFTTKEEVKFETLSQATLFKMRLEQPSKVTYKGEKLERIYMRRSLETVYVNKTAYDKVFSDKSKAYDFAETIEELKNRIDKRKIKTEIEVIE